MIFREILRSNKGKLALAVLIILGIFGSIFLFGASRREQSCVTSIENPAENVCFDTMAEALAYSSHGAIVLPPDASQEDIATAIAQYNSEMATQESEGEE
jgi:hypothetical protein